MTEDDYGKGERTDMEHKRGQGKKQIALITGASSGLWTRICPSDLFDPAIPAWMRSGL